MARGKDRPFHVHHLLARQLRALRLDRRWTIEDVAARARDVGLGWMWDTVAAIERGARQVDVCEFIALPLIFGIELRDLFPEPDDFGAEGIIGIGTEGMLKAHEVREILSAKAGSVAPEDADRRRPHLPKDRRDQLKRLWPRATRAQLEEAVLASEGMAEQKAAASLGVDPVELSIVAASLWGRSLTHERNLRELHRIGDDPRPEPRTLQAIRGNVTRKLLAELIPVLSKKLGRDDL